MKKLVLFLLLVASPMLADSPLTSTDFYYEYQDYDIIIDAEKNGVLNNEMAEFLSNEKVETGAKAALINALGWKFEGKDNAKRYWDYLKNKHTISNETELIKHFSGDELMSLAYMTALDDYFQPQNAWPYMELALKKNPNSTTYLVIAAIIKGQISFDSDWCNIWKSFEEAMEVDNQNWDIRASALFPIIDYLILYKSECN